MKQIVGFLAIVALFIFSACNQNQTAKSEKTAEVASAESCSGCSGCPSKSSCGKETAQLAAVADTDVMVYYFHSNRRCATCKAVESVTREAIADYFETQPEVKFSEVNLDETESEALAEKFQVSGSALIISTNGKVINLTQEAFAKARTAPDELKALLKDTIIKQMSL